MNFPWFGLFPLSFWGYALVLLILVHITIMGVTIFLHREQAHRAVDLNGGVQHFFRFWTWLTTAMNTKAWVAVHRKHHAKCETKEDPHSPKIEGLPKVLFDGVELYSRHAKNKDTLEKFGKGTPNDWLEHNLYSRFPILGVTLMAVADLLLFGIAGITLWALQMVAIPFFAAGVINGVGHHTGYRNFQTADASTNIVPWGVFLVGEELHNNHHAFPSSAKFSFRKWEFDMGWFYLKLLSILGLAKIRRRTPTPVLAPNKTVIDLDTVRGIITNRMHVLRAFSKGVIKPVWKLQMSKTDSPEERRT
ncbi:MAG: acyl-CoA desaturase, partial [Gammaproteobacteria bacterium]|nr:acyl-CoA desaturase [Gammaproteobacteria bacterium]